MTAEVADHFEMQARACDAMGSPFTARLCRAVFVLLDQTTEAGRTILNWPGNPRDDALALRLAGALHALVLSGKSPQLKSVYPPCNVTDEELAQALKVALSAHDDAISITLANAPQTNETARSEALLPGFLEIARQTGLPLSLHEIGSSAGLNLFFDQFRYRFGDHEWGSPAYPAILQPEMRGDNMPDLTGNISIKDRIGTDISPIDITNDTDRLRLRSFVWPDQSERMERLDAAIAVASKNHFLLVREDAADFVEEQLMDRKPGTCFVLFHSVVRQYLPQVTRDRIQSAMDNAGREATRDSPIAWLSMEGLGGSDPFATVHLTIWPGGKMRKLARADFHARWIEWLE